MLLAGRKGDSGARVMRRLQQMLWDPPMHQNLVVGEVLSTPGSGII